MTDRNLQAACPGGAKAQVPGITTAICRMRGLTMVAALLLSACGSGVDADPTAQPESATGSVRSEGANLPVPDAASDANGGTVAAGNDAGAYPQQAAATPGADMAAASHDLPAFKVVGNGRTLYVSASGSNDNGGLSEDSPLRTIQVAMDRAQPGDTVLVRQGEYSNPQNPGGDVVVLRNSGRPDAWISLRAYPGETPLIRTANWSAIKIQSSYVLVDGFSIIGNRDQTTQAQASARQGNLNDPATAGIGIAVGAPWDQPDRHPTHIVIRNNRIEKCPGSGIGMVHADYVLVENNRLVGNAWWSPYGNSGISMYQNRNSDSNTGYKMVVRGNVVTDTFNRVPSAFTGVISDGNGIIVDDSRNTQSYSSGAGSAYTGRTLIDSNLVYANGGRGINIFTSDHVDMVNNTTFGNSLQKETPEGEVSMVSVSDINLVNNILVPLPDRPALTRWNGNDSMGTGASQHIANNIVWGGTGFNGNPTTNRIGVDPRFVAADRHDFRLTDTSPAIDAALPAFSFSFAISGQARPIGRGPDIGAYEMR